MTPRYTPRHTTLPFAVPVAVVLLLALVLPGCKSAYYGTMEALGVHKRDILVDRVESAREGQNQAKEQFQTALEQFMAVVDVEASDLQTKYQKLQKELDRCKADAQRVSDRIASVESVGNALFKEWEGELEEYANDDLRRASAKKLRDTQDQFDKLLTAMRKAEGKMAPVLAAFNDHVLYLKHNLNARAIASLEGVVDTLESDVARLVADMQASIDEADAFISSMSDSEG